MTETEDEPVVTAELLLLAYAAGIFPMADSAESPDMYWVEPEMRGILPLENFHVPRSLKKAMRKSHAEVRFSTAFAKVMKSCAETTQNRPSTWINQQIFNLYCQLHDAGHAHSVEIWQDDELVGGLYGVTLGAAFFGESMFSRQTDASKMALVHLVERLRNNGYMLLDTQFATDHLERFGVIEIPREDYQTLLSKALQKQCSFLDE